MAVNPNWPVIEDAWGPCWDASNPVASYIFSDVTPRTVDKGGIQRGRQYELDQVQTGEMSVVLSNTDGVLDPTNTSSPFAGRIAPYQPMRKRAQWPPTVNLLSQTAATGGDVGGYAVGSSVFQALIFSQTDPSVSGTVTASGSAWQGSNVLQFSVPSATAALSRVCYTQEPAAAPGQTYTMQVRVRNVTASTSLQVKAAIGWYAPAAGSTAAGFTYSSTVTLTGSAGAAWTLLTVTATAPANAAGINVQVAVAATAAATCSIQVDGWQLEKGGTATTWVQPGVWYPMFAGTVERWPSTWKDSQYGVVAPTVVDAFALLSQKVLADPLTQEITSHNPRFLFQLDDPEGSLSASDATGNYPPAPLAASKYGAGSLAFGSQITSNSADGGYTGSTGTVVTLDNPNPGTAFIGPATFIKLGSSGIKGPADPTVWVRTIAFRYTGPAIASGACLWSSMDNQRANGLQSGSAITVVLTTAGQPAVLLAGPSGATGFYTAGGATNCVDGNWHFLLFGYNQASGQVLVSQDGAVAAYYGSVPSSSTPTGLASDNVGCFVDATVGDGTYQNFQGDISFVSEFGGWISTSAAITSLYKAWKNSFAGESTDARYTRILNYAGWTSTKSVQAGLTTAMGPANFGGQDALSALQAVVDTEGGTHYAARDGTATFRSRSARYNTLTPQYIFGENVAGGEYPYESCELDYDPTRLANQVTVTQEATGQQFVAQDAASIAAYFPRVLTRSVNSLSPTECQDAAAYLLSRYKRPTTRVTAIKLHPSAYPALWPVLLSMELGTRVRVIRRPLGAPAITLDVFVESVHWDLDDGLEAYATLQCSPVDLTPYGLFAAWHTTLKTTVASGVTSIVVNASADTTNPLGAQLGFGQQIVLGQGTANQETVTVSAVSATTAGWTSATLTLTAATTKGHTAGDVICEPLPAGITDPATWDAGSQFDATAFAY